MSEERYYEVCDNCGERVHLYFKEESDYTRAKLACECSESQVAFGNVSILDAPDCWGEQ